MSAILVVDDDDAMRLVMTRALDRSGHQVTEASNGLEALDKLSQGSFDLIITDLIMPEMEGIELIQAIRKKHLDIKILGISGGGRSNPDSYLALASGLGANKVLAKPFEIETLLSTVNELTGRSGGG